MLKMVEHIVLDEDFAVQVTDVCVMRANAAAQVMEAVVGDDHVARGRVIRLPERGGACGACDVNLDCLFGGRSRVAFELAARYACVRNPHELEMMGARATVEYGIAHDNVFRVA